MIKEIWKEVRAIESSRAKLREFGITMAAVLALVALWAFFKKHPNLMAGSWWAAVFFIFWGLAYPALLKPLHKAWMGLAVLLGFFVGRILLSALYFLAFTPIALILRLKGRDVLVQKPDPALKTYWTDHADRSDNKEQYERQY